MVQKYCIHILTHPKKSNLETTKNRKHLIKCSNYIKTDGFVILNIKTIINYLVLNKKHRFNVYFSNVHI